jgi:hypothetical protein
MTNESSKLRYRSRNGLPENGLKPARGAVQEQIARFMRGAHQRVETGEFTVRWENARRLDEVA